MRSESATSIKRSSEDVDVAGSPDSLPATPGVRSANEQVGKSKYRPIGSANLEAPWPLPLANCLPCAPQQPANTCSLFMYLLAFRAQ